MAVVSKWFRPGTGTEWWTVPRRTKMAVSPQLSVCVCGGRHNWQAFRLANCVCRRKISTPCWLRKCSNSRFLPRTTFTFQQAGRRALQLSVLLGRAAIFGYKKNDGIQDSAKASCPFGKVSFRCGMLTGGDPLSSAFGCLLYNSRLRLLPLDTATVVRCVVSLTTTALRLIPRGTVSTGEMGAPQAKHRGAYIQLRCV